MDFSYLNCIHSLRSYEIMKKLNNTFQKMKKKGETELNTIPQGSHKNSCKFDEYSCSELIQSVSLQRPSIQLSPTLIKDK